MFSTSYWGEMSQSVDGDPDSGIAAIEREQIVKPRAMPVEGPVLHQPSSRHCPPTNEILPSEHFEMDPIVIHTIRLIQHIKKVQTAITNLQQDLKQEGDAVVTAVGPVPEYEGRPIRERPPQKYFCPAEDQSDFVKGIGLPPATIDEVTCRRLLRRSVAAICAHLSFDNTQESVLETLTDVCQEYILQFTQHLGQAADRRGIYGPDGFPDLIERVCHELGIGSVTSLHDFYQQRVLAYHDKVKGKCQALMAEYNGLVKQPASGTKPASQVHAGKDTLHVIRIKEESSGDIQFPLLDDNDEVAETEQLLNIESLGPFEITVEQETVTGLTTEVETRWSHAVKGGAADGRLKSTSTAEEGADNPPVLQETSRSPQPSLPRTPQSNVASTPQASVPPTPQELLPVSTRDHLSQDDAVIQEPGSLSNMDIFSPPAPTPTKTKKRKTS